MNSLHKRNRLPQRAGCCVNSYRLTEQAETDVFEIFLYGLEHFGRNQARHYKDDLEHCFQMIADYPRMGRPADSIALGVRRHEHQSHVILYEVDDIGVVILAVIHGRSVRRLKI